MTLTSHEGGRRGLASCRPALAPPGCVTGGDARFRRVAGLAWHAKANDLIVATWDVPPEQPELHICIGPNGAVTSYRAQRWHDGKSGYAAFGADVHAERNSDGTTIPSRITAGWGHGTPSWEPFFRGEIVAGEAIGTRARDEER